MTSTQTRPVAAPSVPAPGPAPAAERRRDTRTVTGRDLAAVVGSAAAAVGLTALLVTRVLPFTGRLGVVLLGYALFLVVYTVVVSVDQPGPAVRDRVASTAVHGIAAVLVGALVLVVGFVLLRGRTALVNLNFVTEDLSRSGPLDPLTVGGVLHGVVGTLEQITIALVVVVPLGLLCAVFLSEVPGPTARVTRTIVEAMTALPSIIAGLFVYATLILGFDNPLPVGPDRIALPKSGLAAAMAISVMMLPIVIRAADVVLRLVPGSLREAAAALGASQVRLVWHVVLPTARSGLSTAIILGTARGIGETSPVLLTAGYTAAVNLNPTRDPQVSLPLLTFTLVRSGEPNQIARGFGAGAILLALVLVLFVVARTLGGRGPGELSRRQLRRREGASRRDLARYAGSASERAAPPIWTGPDALPVRPPDALPDRTEEIR